VLAILVVAVACATGLPSPLDVAARLGGTTPGTGQWQQLDALALAAAGLVSWALIGWFALVASLTLAARTAGPHGHVALVLLRGLVPGTLRTALAAVVGLGSVAALSGCTPGPTASTPRAVTTVAELLADPSTVLAIDWPSTAPTPPADASISSMSEPPASLPGWPDVELNWPQATAGVPAPDQAPAAPAPAATPTPEPAPATAGTAPTAETTQTPTSAATAETAPATPEPTTQPDATGLSVVVVAGDTLWAIAADHLPAGATNADIADAWPEWYAANRALIGDDPDLILPGWQLTTPTPDGDKSR